MNCSRCGTVNEQGSLTCKGCGCDLSIYTNNTVSNTTSINEQPTFANQGYQQNANSVVPDQRLNDSSFNVNNNSPKNVKLGKNMIIVFSSIISVIAIVGLIFAGKNLIFNDNKADSLIVNNPNRPIVIEEDGMTKVYDAYGHKLGSVKTDILVSDAPFEGNDFAGGYAVAKMNNREVIINTAGKVVYRAGERIDISKVGYDAFYLRSTDMTVKESAKLINHSGKILVKEGIYEGYIPLRGFYISSYILVENDDKFGLISNKGEILLDCKYSYGDIQAANEGDIDSLIQIEDGSQYYLFESGKNKPLMSNKYGYRVISSDINNTSFVATRDSSEALKGDSYLYENKKLIKLDKSYNSANFMSEKYISLEDWNDAENLYDVTSKKVVGKVTNANVHSNDILPVIISNTRHQYTKNGYTVNILTPYYTKTYEKIGGADTLENGYHYIKTYNDDFTETYYTIYDVKGVQVLKLTTQLKRFTNEDTYNIPVAAIVSGKDVAFICGDIKDSSKGFRLIDSKGKTLIEDKNITSMRKIGSAVHAIYKDGTAKVYLVNGKVLLSDIQSIASNKISGVTVYVNYANIDNSLYGNVKSNDKYGIYDFNNFKYIIEPNLDSISYISEGDYWKATKGDKVTYYNLKGELFK